MIAALLIAAAVSGAIPTDAERAATVARTHPVMDPVWVAIPKLSLMKNCTTGYLTDPTFAGETIYMGCVVQPNGSLGQCKVRESKRAEAAGVQDVAICASAGFRIGPVDKTGAATAGRPMLIPLGIVSGANAPSVTPPAPKP